MDNKKTRGPLQRVSGSDFATAGAIFKNAMFLLVPEDQTQRKAFESLMPYMYVLRNRGCSWPQITKLLTDCGFNLQTSVVRSYYSEMLATRQDICQEQMNEQILLLAEVRKVTKGADISSIAGKVSGLMDRQRTLAVPKIDTMFGLRSVAPAAAVRREPSSQVHENANTNAGPHPVPEKQPQLQQQEPELAESEGDVGNFGLLALSSSRILTSNKPTFFNLDDVPTIPNLSPLNNIPVKIVAATSPHDENQNPDIILRCLPVPSGLKPISKRVGVDEAVYQVGNMEHPAMPGLMLSLDQRLCSVALEFVDDDSGAIRFETNDEKRFRVFWKVPVSMTPTMTAKNFTQMDMTLFGKNDE
jgi:hypothetical protein